MNKQKRDTLEKEKQIGMHNNLSKKKKKKWYPLINRLNKICLEMWYVYNLFLSFVAFRILFVLIYTEVNEKNKYFFLPDWY